MQKRQRAMLIPQIQKRKWGREREDRDKGKGGKRNRNGKTTSTFLHL